MEARAKLSNTRGSARKARLVIDLIRGKDVVEALNILKFNDKTVAGKIEKMLDSAIKNWETKNEGYRAEDNDLYIKEVFADGAVIVKRFRPAPFGRAHRIRKRNSHITLVVDSRVPIETITEDYEDAEVEDITENQETED